MGKYAQDTSVSSELSRIEIERTLIKYGAKGFMYATLEDKAMIVFAMNNKQAKILLPLPKKEDFKYTSNHRLRTENSQNDAWGQACRSKWRSLNLVIKAKLVAIDDDISTFEEEFMAKIVLPGGQTAGEFMLPQIEQAYQTGKMPAMLPMLEGK